MAKKDIESYAHRDKERANNPPVGLVDRIATVARTPENLDLSSPRAPSPRLPGVDGRADRPGERHVRRVRAGRPAPRKQSLPRRLPPGTRRRHPLRSARHAREHLGAACDPAPRIVLGADSARR